MCDQGGLCETIENSGSRKLEVSRLCVLFDQVKDRVENRLQMETAKKPGAVEGRTKAPELDNESPKAGDL